MEIKLKLKQMRWPLSMVAPHSFPFSPAAPYLLFFVPDSALSTLQGLPVLFNYYSSHWGLVGKADIVDQPSQHNHICPQRSERLRCLINMKTTITVFTKAWKRPGRCPSCSPMPLLYFSSEHIIYWLILFACGWVSCHYNVNAFGLGLCFVRAKVSSQ